MNKEIKILFDEEDINIVGENLFPDEFLNALGTALIEGCKNFNVNPHTLIDVLMEGEEENE